MKHFVLSGALFLAAVSAAGCAESPTPVGPDQSASLNKKGTTQTDTESRAIWVWDSTLPNGEAAAISGDGAEYRGDVCGVRARIQAPTDSGDAPFDPDYTASTCPRKIYFTTPTGAAVASGADARVYRINRVDDTRPRIMYFGSVPSEFGKCESLRYGSINSSASTLDEQIISTDSTGVIVTRTNLPGERGEWTVETAAGGLVV